VAPPPLARAPPDDPRPLRRPRRPPLAAAGLAPRGPADGRRARVAACRGRGPDRQLSTAEPAHAPRWGLGDVAVGLIPFAISLLSVLSSSGSDGDDTEVTIGLLLVSSLIGWLFIVGVPVVATKLKGDGPVADLGLRFEVRDLLYFPLGVAVQAIAVPLLYWPILRVLDQTTDDVSDQARELVDAASGAGVLVLVLIVCVGAPIAEELFYRGLVLRSVERRWSTGIAVVASTLLFGIVHLQGLQLPALLLIGAVLAVLTVRSGRLGPAILCHSGFNACTLFVLLVIDT
jgi:membrane protease YdiL (CAAX protease family)